MRPTIFPILGLVLTVLASGCSSGPGVHQEQYAKLKDTRAFENEFPAVWAGIEETFRNYKVVRRDPADATPLELRKMRRRMLETDWINSQSRDKYVEYKVNGFPRRKLLWTRLRYKVTAEAILGGVQVTVKTSEEIERVHDDGSSAGYESVDDIDSSRPSEMLDRIGNAILSAPPTAQPGA